ncbi:transcriptional regulator BolA [Symbiopectobacterium purcellii]|uniref:transcriptional regulator BolA n=1 Tax=Symbiopectobacterium purcellii TaxID=2871826 RepID=UPI003F86500B
MHATIQAKLRAAFTPTHLDVINESHQHRVPAGSQSHFKVVLVSDAFSGQRTIGRHRAVYATLAAELENGLHALALHTYTPQEWADAQGQAPKSPACGGAGIDA